jgi:hypothetical protein
VDDLIEVVFIVFEFANVLVKHGRLAVDDLILNLPIMQTLEVLMF